MKKTKKNKVRETAPTKEEIKKLSFSKWHYVFPIAGIVMIGFIYAEIYKPKLENKWVTGSNLVQNARKEKDPKAQAEMREKGGAILREQVRLHPYHARVLHHYAFYFHEKREWDSCLYYERIALQTGTGGIINRVRSEGKNVYNVALANKLDMNMKDLPKSLELLDKAVIPGFDNPEIKKYRGIVYMNASRFDSSISAFKSYYADNPKDFYALLYLAKDYANTSQLDSARKYAELAKIEQPNDPALIGLLQQLNR